MAKRKKTNNIVPTNKLPKSAVRITNADGRRVWSYKGREFATKKIFMAEAFKPVPEEPKTEETLPDTISEPIEQEKTNEGTIRESTTVGITE